MDIIQETYVRKAKVVKITDGDTIVCLIDMGYYMYVQESLRLARINAPELSTPEGKVAKLFLIEYLPVGSNILVKTEKNKSGSFGRWLGEIYYNNECINDVMVNNGHAIYQTY